MSVKVASILGQLVFALMMFIIVEVIVRVSKKSWSLVRRTPKIDPA